MKKYILQVTICTILTISTISARLWAQTPIKKDENDFYNILNIQIPDGIKLEVGGMCTLPDGRLAVATRMGEVYIISNPDMTNDTRPIFNKYAEGLNEILGLEYKDGFLYCAQRGELTRFHDFNKDGVADYYETLISWPLSGNYHEFSFGPKFDAQGNAYLTFNVGFHPERWYVATSNAPWRGWMVRIPSDFSKIEPFAAGLRSPAALQVLPDGSVFYAENQGDWAGSGGITHLEKGDFAGHPAGLTWSFMPNSPVSLTYDEVARVTNASTYVPSKNLYIEPNDIVDTVGSEYDVAKRMPPLKPQSVTMPHSIMGQSTSDIFYLQPGNSIAPFFEGQLLVGDQFASKIMRVCLEKVNGVYQGAVFDFRKGFNSGVMRLSASEESGLFVGMTNRGWGSIGKEPFGLQKLVWTGIKPFEIKAIKAMPDGFELEFLDEVDTKVASAPSTYKVTSFTYRYFARYGSPIIRDTTRRVLMAKVADDKKKVRIVIDKMVDGFVYEINAGNLLSAKNEALVHNVGYYTLIQIPQGEKLKVDSKMAHAGHDMKSMKMATAAPAPQPKPAPKPKAEAPMGKNMNKMPATWTDVDKSITLGTKPGLYYDQSKIVIKAGQKIKLTFNNVDDMQHNVVITKPGKADAIGEAATNMGLEGPKMHYVPKSDDVLFHTKLVNPGGSETIYFQAPTTPGNYQLVCTYPGHYSSMQALLVVQ